MFEFKAVFGLEFFIELIEQDLPNNHCEVIFDERPDVRFIV